MGEHALRSIVEIATGIIGVAILAVLVSQKANTANVINASGSAFGNALLDAEAPVTGVGAGSSLGSLTSY